MGGVPCQKVEVVNLGGVVQKTKRQDPEWTLTKRRKMSGRRKIFRLTGRLRGRAGQNGHGLLLFRERVCPAGVGGA